MKTYLPTEIKNVKAAKEFLVELNNNNESFHPEDDAHQIIWHNEKPTEQECSKLNSLMEDIYLISNFDPCSFILYLL